MTGRREDDKTVGEIYRRLVDMDERYEKKLDRIEEQVRLTNGRTTTLEANYENIKTEIARLMRQFLHLKTVPAVPVTTPDGESLSIKISKKMFALIASVVAALLIFAPIIADWLKERLAP